MTVVDANGHESAPDDHSGVDVYVMQGDGSTGWALRVNSPTANPNGGTTPVGWYLYVNQGSGPLIRQQPAGQPTPMGEPYWLLAPAPLRATYNARNQTASMTDACGNVVPFTYNGPGEGERLSAGWATSGACVPGEYGATTYTWNGLGLGSKPTAPARPTTPWTPAAGSSPSAPLTAPITTITTTTATWSCSPTPAVTR